MAQGGGGGGGEGGASRRAHLVWLPSVWKASGLEPSFMNFMAETATQNASHSSLPLSLDDSFSAASAQRVACLHFTPPSPSVPGFPLAALLREQYQPTAKQVVVPRNTHGSSRAAREAGWAWFGERRGWHLLAIYYCCSYACRLPLG
jgi:hypothetical protein